MSSVQVQISIWCLFVISPYIHQPDWKTSKLNSNLRRRSGKCLRDVLSSPFQFLSAAISCRLSAISYYQLSAVKSKDAEYPPSPPAAAHPSLFSMQPRRRLSHWWVTSINHTSTLINHERLAGLLTSTMINEIIEMINERLAWLWSEYHVYCPVLWELDTAYD